VSKHSYQLTTCTNYSNIFHFAIGHTLLISSRLGLGLVENIIWEVLQVLNEFRINWNEKIMVMEKIILLR
jgi:hypothetical protein